MVGDEDDEYHDDDDDDATTAIVFYHVLRPVQPLCPSEQRNVHVEVVIGFAVPSRQLCKSWEAASHPSDDARW